MTKFFLFSAISACLFTLLGGYMFNSQNELAYTNCMDKNSNNSYCKVLVWGR